uniref:Uncharacterized protein n=2 Tax=Heliothis virescens TaxID=7102 RepID=A0A2A4IW56_HELVI
MISYVCNSTKAKAPAPTTGVEESLLHSLSALTRRPNPVAHSSTEVLQAVLEVIRKSNALNTENTQANESRAKDTAVNVGSDRSRPSTSNINNSALNGFNHFVNGHKVDGAAPAAVPSSNRYPSTTSVPVRTFPSVTATGAALTPTAVHLSTPPHVSSVAHPTPAPPPPSAAPLPPAAPHPPAVRAVAAPAPAYVPYQAAVPPPPTRGYYPQPYPATANNVPNVQQTYPNSIRVGVTQAPARPSTSATAPPLQSAQHYNPYVMGRYPPQPHHYPPFQ